MIGKKIGIAIACILVFVLVCGIIVACGYAVLATPKEAKAYEVKSMKDIYIPEDMDLSNLGLFWMDENDEQIRYDAENVPYDPSKPIIIYTHGWGDGCGAKGTEYWQALGYNVGCFRWGQFSTNNPFDPQSKLYGKKASSFYWEKDDGSFEKRDVPDTCIIEIFIACYNDFMTEYGFYGDEIRFFGHSLGAQASIGMMSYMLTAYENGKFDPQYIPDRLTLLDPYISDMEDTTYVSWLNRTLKDGGTAKLTLETAKQMANHGIVVEGVRTSVVKAIGSIMGTNYYEQLDEYISWVDVSAAWLNPVIDIANLDMASEVHEYAIYWYEDMIPVAVPENTKYKDGYGLSPMTPLTYMLAVEGVDYEVPQNILEDDMSDDLQYSTNLTAPIIAGVAYLDRNRNGINDDRVNSRVANVKVGLYDSDNKLVAEQETTLGGQYKFVLTADSVGKEYYVKVEALPTGYSITKLGDATIARNAYLGVNDISSDTKCSKSVKITSLGTVQTFNIGVRVNLLSIFTDGVGM